jgi:hypothetical protein
LTGKAVDTNLREPVFDRMLGLWYGLDGLVRERQEVGCGRSYELLESQFHVKCGVEYAEKVVRC